MAGALWSDSVLQTLYDAVHAAALSLAGATSLLHEAKVDVVTVPNLSEHLLRTTDHAELCGAEAVAGLSAGRDEDAPKAGTVLPWVLSNPPAIPP